jgi:hypothetical protein
MPHRESRVRVSIWDDRDWLKLPIDGQWLYQAFLSQQFLTKAGVLPIPRRMWANLAADEDAPDRIAAALKLLIERTFVVVDDDTDELLVRSYLRNAVQYGPPGTFRAGMDAAIAVRSRLLRAVLYEELLRLDVAMIEVKGFRGGEAPIAAYRRALAALAPDAQPPPGPGGTPDDHAMDMPCSCHTEGGAEACHEHGIPHAMGYRPVVVDVAVDVVARPQVGNNSSLVRPARTSARTRAHADAHVGARDPAPPPSQDPPPGRNGLQVVMDSGTVSLPARVRDELDVPEPGVARRRAASATFQAIEIFEREAADWPVTPTGRERGRWVHAVAHLVTEGIPGPAIVLGMRACADRGFGPRALDSFVFGEANKRGLESRADRNTKAILSRITPDGGPTLAELEAAENAERAAVSSRGPRLIEGG